MKSVTQTFTLHSPKKGSIRYSPIETEQPISGAFYFNKIDKLAGKIPTAITITVAWDELEG
jgi:hypothetical protein